MDLGIGIVIVNWNVCDLLANCLTALLADLDRSGLNGRVWVVDNGSQDGSPAMVRERFPDVRLIANEDNPGFGPANNRAFREMGFEPDPPAPFPTKEGGEGLPSPFRGGAGGGIHLPFAVLCLNPDTEVRPGALRCLHDFMNFQPRVGIVGAKLLNPDGSLQHSGFRYPGLAQATLDLFPPPRPFERLLETRLNGRYPASCYSSKEPFQVDFTLGAAFMIRAEALGQSGGFDETYHLYCEEIDWAWRLEGLGWERWLHPDAEVMHLGGKSTSQTKSTSLRALWQARRQLYTRYRSPLTVKLTGWLVRAAMHRRQRRASSSAEAETYRAIANVWQV